MGASISEIDKLRNEYDAGLMNAALERIRQLEKLNATLAAEVDRQRAVVEAVGVYYRNYLVDADNKTSLKLLRRAYAAYEASRGAS